MRQYGPEVQSGMLIDDRVTREQSLAGGGGRVLGRIRLMPNLFSALRTHERTLLNSSMDGPLVGWSHWVLPATRFGDCSLLIRHCFGLRLGDR